MNIILITITKNMNTALIIIKPIIMNIILTIIQ